MIVDCTVYLCKYWYLETHKHGTRYTVSEQVDMSVMHQINANESTFCYTYLPLHFCLPKKLNHYMILDFLEVQ